MTDQPRGAYTPQQDTPLQFDARSPSRRPMPMALIASGALLVVLVAAVAMYYSRGVRGDNEPPRPVGEPVATLKSAPAAGAQPTDPAGPDVYAAQAAPGKAPSFAAAPELPKPRPAPAAPTRLTVQTLSAADMNKPDAATVTVAAAPKAATLKTATTTAAPSVATPASPVAKPAAPVLSAPVLAAKTATPKTAAPKTAAASSAPVKVAASPSVGGVRVQIGAFSSAALADKGYGDVSALMPGAMSGRTKHVEPVDKDGQTLYRTSVAGFSDRASAAAFCDALKAKGKICFVKS